MAGELVSEYEEYLARFAEKIGDVAIGSFAKFNGKLIKKLAYEEFEPLYQAYKQAYEHYEESIERGDTINDLIVKTVRDRATDLVMDNPV